MNLSPEQRRAVERAGQDVCVVAGPGSGKTRVLTERFAWLVEQNNVSPARILAITFTEKGALEIKQRLIKRFDGDSGLRNAIERAWVSTIHGFCARLLRENAIAAGLAPDFVVLEAPAAARIEREAADEALDALFIERPAEMRRLMEALDLSTQHDGRQPDLAASLVTAYEKMRVAGVGAIPVNATRPDAYPEARRVAQELLAGPITGAEAQNLRDWAATFLALPATPLTRAHFESFPLRKIGRNASAKRLKEDLLPELESQWIGEWYADLQELLRTAIQRIGEAFRARKRRESTLDFSDLEEYTLQLLTTDSAVRKETVARFDHVLMDELQDTNPLQWKIIDLVRTRLFAVGDINQSIYGFRDADPSVFLNFRDTSAVEELRENYRSRPEILDIVSQMLNGQPGIEPRELIAVSPFPAASPVVERLVGTGDDAESVEAALIAQRIRHWHDSGVFRYGDMAVLFRTFASADPLQRAFHRFGIPFLLSGGRNFMEARECLDLLNLLAALANPLDEIPLLGVLRSPMGGRLQPAAGLQSGSFGRGPIEIGPQAEACPPFDEVRRHAGYFGPDRLIARALDWCGYTGTLAAHQQANVDQLLAWLRTEFRRRPRPLPELLEDLEALRDAQNSPPAPPPEAGDVVRMMTIHAAKGLEFPAAFLCGLHRSTDRRTAPVLFSADLGIGGKWRHPVTNDGVSDPTHAALKEREKQREDEESNRLLYVGMTRAQDRLVLSYAEKSRASAWRKMAEAAVPDAIVSEVEPEPLPPIAALADSASQAELAAPAITGQYDSAASVTSVALFAACPRRYYLARYLGLEPVPTGPGTGAIELGIEVHSALAGEPTESPEASALAARFHATPLGQRAARATRIEREFDFMFELDDVILRGQIDLWFEEGGERVLVDYKTDRDEAAGAAYALQLQLYALALGLRPHEEIRMGGRLEPAAGLQPGSASGALCRGPIEIGPQAEGCPPFDRAVLHFLRSDKTVDVSLTPDDLSAARRTVERFRQAQDDLVFPLQPGDQCKKCSFRGGLCPEGREGVNSGLVSWMPSSSPRPATSGS